MKYRRCLIISCVLVPAIQLAHSSVLVAAPEGILQQAFFNPTPENSDDFGESVAAQGNKVFVGARFDNTGASDSGAAYIFDQAGGLLKTFLNPTPASSDQFGSSVLLVGNSILVGAIRDDTAGADAGAAYLFNQSGGLLQTFLNPTPGGPHNDEFGFSLAAPSNGDVAISAYRDNSSGPDAGAVYLFNQSGTLLQTILHPTPSGGEEFGRALTAVGDKLLIGARNDNTGAQRAGAAYLYDTSGNLLQTFLNPTPAADDNFGWSPSCFKTYGRAARRNLLSSTLCTSSARGSATRSESPPSITFRSETATLSAQQKAQQARSRKRSCRLPHQIAMTRKKRK